MVYTDYQGIDPFYMLTFTDGYIVETGKGDLRRPMEERLAERLFSLTKKLHVPHAVRPLTLDPVHVWVLGNEDWSRQPPKALEGLMEHEQDMAYRAVIIGLGMPPPPNPNGYSVRLHAWLLKEGMAKKKLRTGRDPFRKEARSLMKLMHAS